MAVDARQIVADLGSRAGEIWIGAPQNCMVEIKFWNPGPSVASLNATDCIIGSAGRVCRVRWKTKEAPENLRIAGTGTGKVSVPPISQRVLDKLIKDGGADLTREGRSRRWRTSRYRSYCLRRRSVG